MPKPAPPKYRTTNWSAYNAALKQRGSLDIWFDPDIDFGVERDPGRRFALWTVMDALGIAPAPADAFEEPALRRAAEDYLTAAWRIDRADGTG